MMYIWLILGIVALCGIANIYLLPRQSPAVRAAWSLFWTLACAAVIAFICYHFYDFLLIALPVACVISLTAWWQQRKQPRRQWGKILIWALMFAGIFATHEYRAHTRRTEAEAVLAQIQQFRALHRRFPSRQELFGVESGSGEVPQKWRNQQLIYIVPEGRPQAPLFGYRSTRNPFDTYLYDFDRNAWRFATD